MYYHNQAILHIASNPVFNEKIKYRVILYEKSYFWEKFVGSVGSIDQLGDMLTKSSRDLKLNLFILNLIHIINTFQLRELLE